MIPTRTLRRAAPAAAVLLLAACGSSQTPAPLADAGVPPIQLEILHTNDLHSHLAAFDPVADFTPEVDGDDSLGGFARLATQVKQDRIAAKGNPVLLLDSGDFMMGTPFQLIGTKQAAELTEMGRLGYDAITLGNHEFDFTSLGLAGILNAAINHGFSVPIVASNIRFDPKDSRDDTLAAFQTAEIIVPKLVKVLPHGLKVGIFGLMGKNAAQVAPLAAPVTFADQEQTARAMVDELRNQDHVDVVIALSHSGTDEHGIGEDEELARQVDGIDVIVSGHTHVALEKPVQVNQTYIVQTGSYGLNLGHMTLAFHPDRTPHLELLGYQLEKIDDSIAADPAVDARIDGYVKDIDQVIAPLSYAMPVATTAFDVPKVLFAESPMGDVVADAYRTVVSQVQPTNPPQIAAEVGGNVRAGLFAGKTGRVEFADLFQVTPLGIGPDQKPGYPLVSFYLNGRDLKSGLELSSMAEDFLRDDDYFLQLSGLGFTYSKTAPLFSRVISATLQDGTPVDLNDTSKCYQVVATYYVASLFGLVRSATGGMLSVTPKEADCATPVTNLAAHLVDADPFTPGVQELHQWQAVYGYVSAFPDTDGDGIPNFPAVYQKPQGRIVAQ